MNHRTYIYIYIYIYSVCIYIYLYIYSVYIYIYPALARHVGAALWLCFFFLRPKLCQNLSPKVQWHHVDCLQIHGCRRVRNQVYEVLTPIIPIGHLLRHEQSWAYKQYINSLWFKRAISIAKRKLALRWDPFRMIFHTTGIYLPVLPLIGLSF